MRRHWRVLPGALPSRLQQDRPDPLDMGAAGQNKIGRAPHGGSPSAGVRAYLGVFAADRSSWPCLPVQLGVAGRTDDPAPSADRIVSHGRASPARVGLGRLDDDWVGRTGARGSGRARGRRPRKRTSPVKQLGALPTAGRARRAVRPPVRSADPQKRCSGGMRWAREELNLRPLPCQAMRGPSRGPSPPCMAPRQPCSGGLQNRAPQCDVRPRMASLLTNC